MSKDIKLWSVAPGAAWMNQDKFPDRDQATRAIDRIGMKTLIHVKGEYDGFHKYENAPSEVAFLRSMHRHLFKWEAIIQVYHYDRELEFFMVKTRINREIIPFTTGVFDLGSCEQQAERILKGLLNTYGVDRYYLVKVSEDGENGASVIYDP